MQWLAVSFVYAQCGARAKRIAHAKGDMLRSLPPPAHWTARATLNEQARATAMLCVLVSEWGAALMHCPEPCRAAAGGAKAPLAPAAFRWTPTWVRRGMLGTS